MNFDFSTPSGTYELERTSQNLSPFGGLVAFSSFLKHLGILEKLEENFPVVRTSNNALPVRDILVGFMLTILLDGRRFSDIRYIQNDPIIGKAFGVKKRIPCDDTVRRLLESIDSESGKKMYYAATQFLYEMLPEYYVTDWDGTVTTRYGNQEGVEIGYNPQKPGRGSHHPLICSVGGLRLCLDIELRNGNVHSADNWISSMERLFMQLPPDKQPWLNRADIGFCGEKFLRWHETQNGIPKPKYLFKLKKTPRVREAILAAGEDEWEGCASINALQLKECELQLHGWEKKRRVILGRRLISIKTPIESNSLLGECDYHYYAYVTNLTKESFTCWQVADLYDKRADCENIFDELKNHWGLGGFCAQKKHVTEFSARMTLLTYNLWSLFVRFFNISNHEEARNSRREFLLMPAKLVKSGNVNKVNVSVSEGIWSKIELGYERLVYWLERNAPQLRICTTFNNLAMNIGALLSPQIVFNDGS